MKASYLEEVIFERIEFNFTPSVSHLVKKEKKCKITIFAHKCQLEQIHGEGIILSQDYLSSFRFRSTSVRSYDEILTIVLLSTNDITFNLSTFLLFVRSIIVLSHACTPVLQKEIKLPRLKSDKPLTNPN